MRLRDWFRLKVMRKPVDYGDGLSRLPDFGPGRDGYTGERIDAAWAAAQWDRWQTGRGGWSLHNDAVVCPACYETAVAEDARYMAAHHGGPAARRRWSRIVREHELKIAALGPCRCGTRMTSGQAAANAVKVNSRYGDFRTP